MRFLNRRFTPALFLVLLISGCNLNIQTKDPSVPQEPPPNQPPPAAGQRGSVTVSPQYVALSPQAGKHFEGIAQDGGKLQWLVNGVPSGNAINGTVDAQGNYTAPTGVSLSMNVTITAALAASPQTDYATAVVSIIAPGIVTSTRNSQVATYSIYLPAPGKVSVDFGTDTNYGLVTWKQSTPTSNGGQISLYVAGMRARMTYHMRAEVTLDDGAVMSDNDHTFLTGSPPTTSPVSISFPSSAAQPPQPGIELFDTLIPQEGAQAFATDLKGNVIWTYIYTDGTKMDAIQPISLLPNGRFLVLISYASSIALKGGTILPNTIDAVREVDLAGDTLREVKQSDLATALIAKVYQFTVGSLHHDVLALPNGHWLILATITKSFMNLPGYPGETKVWGDLIVDIDEHNQIVWLWNSFDHLNINRHPYLFPDWTHSNSLLYSADDHNLLLSVRHQNWIVKIDYEDGQGSGKILWHLGQGGDFKLVGGIDPYDWFYAQHGPDFFSQNTAGLFRLGVMDNGDDRPTSAGTTCGASGVPSCYSRAPIYQIDEMAMTATLLSQYVPPPNLYSYFGGNVQHLANDDVQIDFAAFSGGSLIQEITEDYRNASAIWQAQTKGSVQYRTERLPSLYPGVQW